MSELIKKEIDDNYYDNNNNNNNIIQIYSNCYNLYEQFIKIVYKIVNLLFYKLKNRMMNLKNELVDIKNKQNNLKDGFIKINNKQQILENEIYKMSFQLLQEIKMRDDKITELENQLYKKEKENHIV